MYHQIIIRKFSTLLLIVLIASQPAFAQTLPARSAAIEGVFAKAAASLKDPLTLFGLLAVTLMLIFYALENRSVYCVLAFGIACIMGSTYGFLQGAWPFGLVEGIWSLVAFRRFWVELKARKRST